MAADQAQSVTKIFLSQQAFELICRSNYLLSMRDQKQRQLQQVITQMLDILDSITESALSDLTAMSPLGGETTIFIRLGIDEATKLNSLQTKALEDHKTELSLRETVIALCLSLIEKFA